MIIITLLASVTATYMEWVFADLEARVLVKFSAYVYNDCTLGSERKDLVEEHCHHMSRHSEQIIVCSCIVSSEEQKKEG